MTDIDALIDNLVKNPCAENCVSLVEGLFYALNAEHAKGASLEAEVALLRDPDRHERFVAITLQRDKAQAEAARWREAKAEPVDWDNWSASPEQMAEMGNLDGPLSRSQIHPEDYVRAIMAAGPPLYASPPTAQQISV
jgi:hypothetical protein